MKRIIKTLSAMAAIAALVVSCNKEKDYAGKEEVPGDKLRFEATAAEVKTTIENGSGAERIVKWAAGDEITIYFDGGSAEATASEAGTSTTFEATTSASAENYYAVYPKDGASAFAPDVDPSRGVDSLKVVVPATQDGAFAKANFAVATTTAAAKSFAFKNATALVKFSVGDGYTKAVFTGNKGEIIAGTVPVTFGNNDIDLVVSKIASPAKKIEVNFNGAGDYYFAVLPQTFETGFSIILYKGDAADAPKAVHASRTLARSTILNLGKVDEVDSITDYFVTPLGKGKKSGKSWDNAMGVAELKALLEQPLDASGDPIAEASDAKAALLDGVTIHMAAGDYYLAEGETSGRVKVEFSGYSKQVAITFRGGYPADKTGTDVSGWSMPTAEGAAPTYCTAFTGNKETGIFLFGNQTDITFQGITFENASFDGSRNDGALFCSAGNSGDCSLTLTNCRILDNKNTTDRSGAGIILYKAAATISNCYFKGNYARNAGALFLPNGTGNVGTKTISSCTFENNSASNTSGAVQNGGQTDVAFDNCTFTGNSCPTYGGAFHTGSSAVTTFEDCTFISNTCTNQGGAISLESSASATFTRCTFTGNTASKGDQSRAGNGELTDTNEKKGTALEDNISGGAIFNRGNGSVSLNACTFTNNTAPNGCGGAIGITDTSSTLNINDGTSFSGNTAYFHGGAIMAKGGISIIGTNDSKVTFNNCKTLCTGSGQANGGAIWLGDNTTSSFSYAIFEGNEAGQEEGSTVNYSNGGAARLMKVTSFEADHCVFTGNRGRNGGCFSFALGTSSKCKITNSNFHDNICRSGAGKNGTSGSFYGAVGHLAGGTVEFEGCTIKDNVVKDNSAVLHINGTKAVAKLTDCTLTGNYCVSNNFACIKMEKAGEKLYMNRCLFEGNHAVSRGMINPASNTLVYLNRVTFKDNYVTGDASHNSWGVNIHAADAIVCMNNVTSIGNHGTDASSSNRYAFNSDGTWLITNSTIIDNTPAGLIRANAKKTRPCVLRNNILINTATPGNVITKSSSAVMTDSNNVKSPDYSDSSLGGSYNGSWTVMPYYGIYSWINNLNSFTPVTQTEVEDAMNVIFTETDSNISIDKADIGKDFYNWLATLGETWVDGRGIARTGTWWPGAYQAN